MKKILVILASTRPGRAGEGISNWVIAESKKYDGNLSFTLIDLKALDLPFLDEPFPPMMGKPYTHEHSRNWSQLVDHSDGFIIVTPEYNHGYPASLKNALDFLYKEWVGKKVGLVGYGGSGARESIRQIKEVLSSMKMKPLYTQVGISDIWEAFDDDGKLKIEKIHGDINELFKELE